MAAVIQVPPGGLAEAICGTVRQWSDSVEAGQLRVTPNPLDPSTYLVIAGAQIVATLHVSDTEGLGPLDVE